MRQKFLILTVLLVSVLGLSIFTATAQCTPTPGTGSTTNDIITCNGDDPDGVNTGAGTDTVTVTSGTVLDTILNEGGILIVVINGGAIDTTLVNRSAVAIVGNGTISVQGNVRSGAYTIILLGNGNIISTGNIIGTLGSLFVDGDGSITSVGNLSATDVAGISIYMGGSGTVTSTGNINGGSFGILVNGGGTINSVGNVTGGVHGIFMDKDGIINSIGDVFGGVSGLYLGGDGTMNTQGNISGTLRGIQGGNGSQTINIISGSVSAPIAVLAGEGNDRLNIGENTTVTGDIYMEGGDDIVHIRDYAVVTGIIYGGETGEVFGDQLIIGSDRVCSEDGQAVANAQIINALDPNGGSIVYLGQTYTWAEFEHITGGKVERCVGFIDDGRINAYDLGAPDALYCTVEKGVSVWEIDLEGMGTFSFAISADQIDAAVAAAVASGTNQLFAEDNLGNQFYALSDGQHITFVAPELREPGKQYQFMFDATRCD